MDARKTRFETAEAWRLLHSAKRITVAKGKKIQQLDPARDGEQAILQQVMGPSGNLRAPALRSGDAFVIGFNAEFYHSLWGKP